VVGAYGRAHDVPNLFVSEGSQFTTGAAASPTLTIVALAIRRADHIAEQMAQHARQPLLADCWAQVRPARLDGRAGPGKRPAQRVATPTGSEETRSWPNTRGRRPHR
jgi:choline dehydrogenase-like flavoprotein